MQPIIFKTIQCKFNTNKTVKFKKSNCSHYYQRQFINNNPVTKWQRITKKNVHECIKRFN